MKREFSLSVVIPTLNEEQDIAKAIASVSEIASEVIIIDSGSTDKTVEIARSLGAKVFQHPFKSFSDHRNFGNQKATSDWILSIEADVIVTLELAAEISQTLTNTAYAAFYIERINQIWGKSIMHTNWGPRDDCHIWLYKKDSGKWQGKVHEEFILKIGESGRLKSRLFHHNYDTIAEFIDKFNKYSNFACVTKKKISFFDGCIDFLKRYFYKLGFLDGYHGLFLSYLQAIYFLTVFVKQQTQTQTIL